MKKTLIAALTTVFVSGNALAASPFDGLYGGLSVGSLNTTSETTGTLVDVDEGEDFSESLKLKQKSDGGTLVGLLVGYGQTFDRFYFGGEFNYRNSLGDTKRSRDIADVGRFTAETQLGQSLSLSLMPGYLAMDNLLVYARFSYGLTEAETKFGFREQDGLFNQKFEYSGNVTTIGFGIGAEYALANNISVRGEWMSLSSSNFDTTGITFDDGTDRFGIKAKTDKISTSGVELSLLYRF